MTTVSIDAMGGDVGPASVLPGVALALERRPELDFRLFGLADACLPVLNALPALKKRSEFIECDVVVAMDDKPSQALRQGRWKSSMWKSIEAVKTGDADVCVSAGNTGALMAMSKFCLRTMADIERPAIAALWPTLRGESVVLDVGATIGADAQALVDYSVMGAAMARALLGVSRPSIGLLNVGVEEVKGLEEVREAGNLLRIADLQSLSYAGFVEGNDLGNGTVDVVVTEGFTGNIALKTAEGTARQISSYLRDGLNSTWSSRLGYFFARGAFERLKSKMDPSRSNGGVFLGLNGIVVKSHGGADAQSFAAAVAMADDMVKNGLLGKIEADIRAFHASQGRHKNGAAPQTETTS